ncbi:hypothetical protein EI77_00035 [Prosthecobacter fusiformis]|uniref:Uncharacterized protein n=1 Tax=Prosthecobacter fusiformis TaxID=48464 RepID=A0A4R7SRG2_9BACT|nr:hypothetical protein EI77_00035 [Prosthecobacter fusiformis]
MGKTIPIANLLIYNPLPTKIPNGEKTKIIPIPHYIIKKYHPSHFKAPQDPHSPPPLPHRPSAAIHPTQKHPLKQSMTEH